MAVSSEKRTSTMILDGKQPAKTIKDLARDVKILDNHIKKLDRSSDEFKEAAGKARQLKKELAEANAQTRLLSKNSRSFGQMFKSTIAAVVGGNLVTAGIQSLLQVVPKLIKKNAELSDSYADIQKTTGMALEETKQYDKLLKTIDTRTPRKELRELTVEAGRLGIRGSENLLGFVKTADKIKVALGDDLGGNANENIRIIGKLTEQYQVAEKEQVSFAKAMEKTGSVINELSASGTTQADYLVNFTKRISGVTNEAGIAIDKVLAYGATLDEAGQNVEVSGTTISKTITKMFTNTAEFANIAQIGVKEFTELLNTDADQAFKLFLKGLNGNNEGLKLLATKLNDAELSGDRAVGVLASLANNVEKLEQKQTIANKALAEGTSLTDEFDKKNKNFAGTVDRIGKKMAAIWTNSTLRAGIVSMTESFGEMLGINQKQSEALTKVKDEMNAMIEVAKGLNVEDTRRAELIKEINIRYGDYLPQLIDEKANIDELNISQARSNQLLDEKIKLMVREEVFSEEKSRLAKAEREQLESMIELEQKRIEVAKLSAEDSYGFMDLKKEQGLNDRIKYLEEKLIPRQKAAVETIRKNMVQLEEILYGKKTTPFPGVYNKADNPFAGGNTNEQSKPGDENTLVTESTDKAANSALDRAAENLKRFRQTVIDEWNKIRQNKMTEEAAEIDRITIHYATQQEMLTSFYDQKLLSYQEYMALKKELEQMEQAEIIAVEEVAMQKEMAKDQAELEKMEEELANKKAFKAEIDIMQMDEIDQEIARTNQKYDALKAQAEAYGLDTVAIEELRANEISAINAAANQDIVDQEAAKAQAVREINQNLFNALLDFIGSFAQESEFMADFERGLAFFQIALSQAQALANALKTTTSPTLDNIATGGLSGLAKFATISTSILTTAAAAKRYILPTPKAPTFSTLSTGALLNGPKHSQGGLSVIRNGEKILEMEGNEAVLSSNTVSNNPEAVSALLTSSTKYGGANISQIPQFNYGAMTQAARGIKSGGADADLMVAAEKMLAAANKMMGAIESFPSDIEAYVVYEHLKEKVLNERRQYDKSNNIKGIDKRWPNVSGIVANNKLDRII